MRVDSWTARMSMDFPLICTFRGAWQPRTPAAINPLKAGAIQLKEGHPPNLFRHDGLGSKGIMKTSYLESLKTLYLSGFSSTMREGNSMAKPILIDFSAKWCGPCKYQAPILEELKERMGDNIEIRVIDVDQNIDEAVKYGIRVVPTLVVEKDGQIIRTLEGVTQADELEVILSPLVE